MFFRLTLIILTGTTLAWTTWATTPKAPTDFDYALTNYYHGNLETSIAYLRKIITLQPDDLTARVNLIQVLQENQNFSESITSLKYLTTKFPTETKYHDALVKATYLTGDQEAVLKLTLNDDFSAPNLYWRGLALAELAKNDAAIQTLGQSLDLDPFNPMANFKIGELYLATKKYDWAETYLRRSLKQEPNLSQAYYPLAMSCLAQEKIQAAYSYLQNSIAYTRSNQIAKKCLEKLKMAHPEILKENQETIVKKRATITPPIVSVFSSNRENIPQIKVGLAEKIQRIYLKAGGAFQLKTSARNPLYTGNAMTVLEIEKNSTQISVSDQKNNLICQSNESITLSYLEPAATTVLFDLEYGLGGFWTGQNDRAYRGEIQFLLRPDGITVINQLNMEEYLYAVVPSEMPSTWPIEALKTQAVAARTYAFANLGQFRSRGFDVMATVVSQAYNGVNAETANAQAAVNATRSQVLTNGGKPIAAFFSGNDGGHTQNSGDLWSLDLPYLKAIPDPLLPIHEKLLTPDALNIWLRERPLTYSSHPNYSGRSSYRWIFWLSRTEIETRLDQNQNLGQIISVIVSQRADSGMAKEILIKGTNGEKRIKGDAIRGALGGLRSNLFVIEPKLSKDGLPEYFICYGGGWGHGIGMCQSGAAGMAADDYDFQTILTHYYPNATLTKFY